MKSKCIIIPIYKEKISEFEIKSLLQCFHILGKHNIFFITYKELDTSFYSYILDRDLSYKYFDKSYFNNISGYNKLMLSKKFYECFINYDYMLIYQLDCYVFRDDLDFWCEQNYDYIGAPWLFEEYYKLPRLKRKYVYLKNKYNLFINPYKLKKEDIYLKVGNGGFSLRKINSFLNALNNKYLDLFKSNDATSLYNEDVFWSLIAEGITKPDFILSCDFSLDPGAPRGYYLNNNNLPFGCHAWDRNKNFWNKFIDL